jgi:hypothetical protein
VDIADGLEVKEILDFQDSQDGLVLLVQLHHQVILVGLGYQVTLDGQV